MKTIFSQNLKKKLFPFYKTKNKKKDKYDKNNIKK